MRLPGLDYLRDLPITYTGDMEATTQDVFILKPCITCGLPSLFAGPLLLSNARTYCGELCDRIDDARLPGVWVDAAEIMEGGALFDRLPSL